MYAKWKDRPHITIEPDDTDRALSLVAWAMVLVVLVTPIALLPVLPDRLPMHFNAAGQPTSSAGRWSIIVLGVVSALTAFGVLMVTRIDPRKFNYATTITEDNAEGMYRLSLRFVRVMSICVSLVFLIIEAEIALVATRGPGSLGVWMLPLLLAIIFAPIGWFLLAASKIAREATGIS
ncbi:MAG: DUF1648 domain-containing protein [Planctomycetota bacterium]